MPSPTLLKLRQRHEEPPGGWLYRDPDTKFLLRGGTLAGLVDMVARHRARNGLEAISDAALQELVEDQICRRIPPELVEGPPPGPEEVMRGLSSNVVVRLTQAFLSSWARASRAMCLPEVAADRARSCNGCSHNAVTFCIGCQGLDVWVMGYTGGRGTPFDRHLRVCEVDGVMLLAAVHAATPFVDSEFSGMTYPQHCWKHRGSKEEPSGHHEDPDDQRGRAGAADAG